MKITPPIMALLLIASAAHLAGVEQLVPYYKYQQTLTASADSMGRNYLMAPSLIAADPGELLIGYKRGYSHLADRDAETEVLRFGSAAGQILGRAVLSRPGINFQNVEFARFANGEIAAYIDMQQSGTEDGQVRAGPPSPVTTMNGGGAAGGILRARAVKLGLIEFRSADGGRTWQDRGKLGLIDGVEYGYAFEAITEGETTWMLIMTFSRLPGGRVVDPLRPHAGSVDVIRTNDNGRTWRRVRNLTEEFAGVSMNESSFMRHGDGFIVSVRGYDNRQWLMRTDGDFRLRQKQELNAAHPFVQSYVGRPRVFQRDGRYYLMGRNWDKPPLVGNSVLGHDQAWERQPGRTPMKLSLFRFDPDTLAIRKHVILDNALEQNVIDGYYAMPYWQERQGRIYFNVVTYKRLIGRIPDIIRLEFNWEEVR